MANIMWLNIKQWFHRWGSPPWFYQRCQTLSPWLFTIAIGLLIIGSVWGLAIAPEERYQGNSYRIIFFHVPAAIVAQSVYIMMAVAGLLRLVWNIKLAELFIICAASVGVSFTFLALCTGAFWGKPTWGTWWFWDARTTSTLILFFLYVGVIALHSAFQTREIGGKAIAVLAMVGALNIPIIKYSVDWWYSLHQPSTFSLTAKPAMDMSMWMPLLVMVIGYYCFAIWAVTMRMSVTLLERDKTNKWGSN